MLPKLGLGNEVKSLELVVGTLWDPVFINLFGLYEGLDGLGIVHLHLLQALLVSS